MEQSLEAVQHMSRPELIDILEFVLSVKSVEDWESLDASIQSLSKRILREGTTRIIYCSDVCTSNAKAEPIDHSGKPCPTNARMGEEKDYSFHSSIGAANRELTRQEAEILNHIQHHYGEVSKKCIDERGRERNLCLISTDADYSGRQDGVAVFQALLPYIDDAFSRISQRYAISKTTAAVTDSRPLLTPREKEILEWTSQGKGCWETGVIVGISERTVKFHLHNVYKKLDVTNRAQAIASAMRCGLI